MGYRRYTSISAGGATRNPSQMVVKTLVQFQLCRLMAMMLAEKLLLMSYKIINM